MFLFKDKTRMIDPDRALPGREAEMPVPERHEVLGTPLKPPFPENTEQIVLGLGCFWGAERLFWQLPGVYTTAVGYAGGLTRNPTYEEVCSGSTGHTEVVLVVWDPAQIGLEAILKAFWEGHDPTQGMRQGNDVGTQYRSVVFAQTPGQRADAEAVVAELAEQRIFDNPIVTQIEGPATFYPAETHHQDYFERNGSQPYCAYVVAPKVAKFRKAFAERLKRRPETVAR
jgi:peptide-methionine (S)-S-oxide reductase